MKNLLNKTGYSLVEVLVAVSVLLIAIVGPMTIAAQGIKTATFALEQNSAFFLAQEGIEAVIELKGNYAVEDIANGISGSDPDTSWDWIDDVLTVPGGPCPDSIVNSNGASCSFGIDFRDSTLSDNLTSSQCTGSNLSLCLLYFDETDPWAIYSHSSAGGTPSPFTRIVTVTNRADYAVEVTSTVIWDSAVFGGQTQTLTLTTNLFDSNF